MKVIKSKVSDLTGAERKACRDLSFRDEGLLSSWLRVYPESKIVRLIDDDGKLLGWGMKTPWNRTGYYVRASERRKGYGSFIFYELNGRTKNVVVEPHDPGSYSFFYSLGKINKDTAQVAGADVKSIRRKTRRSVLKQFNSVVKVD